MSYSRWSHSRWYTFFHCDNSFSINSEEYPYERVKNDWPSIRASFDDVTEDELKELDRYRDRYLEDYEAELKAGTL